MSRIDARFWKGRVDSCQVLNHWVPARKRPLFYSLLEELRPDPHVGANSMLAESQNVINREKRCAHAGADPGGGAFSWGGGGGAFLWGGSLPPNFKS